MLKYSVRNLFTRPMRSLLSLLGLAVAILGMVGLFSVAEGIDEMVSTTFSRIPGLLVMQPGAPVPLFSRLPSDWEADIAAVEGVRVVNPEIWVRANVIDGKPIMSPPRFLFGTDIESRLKLRHGVYTEAVVEGRFLTLADRGTRNTVISRPIAEEFKKQVGDTLVVDGQKLRIVGIYDCGSMMLDVAIIVDLHELRQMSRMDGAVVSSFYVELVEGVDRDAVIAGIRDTLRGRDVKPWIPSAALALAGGTGSGRNPLVDLFQGIDRLLKANGNPASPVTPGSGSPSQAIATSPQGEAKTAGDSAESNTSAESASEADSSTPSVEVRTAEDWGNEIERMTADLDLFLLIMTGIGVTIAVLSIVNTMLMSVTERFIEFGILKANGWSNGDVLKLVTLESALLGLAGGTVGASLGWVATLVLNAYFPHRIHLHASPGLLLFSLGFSVALGVLGGLYPAVWASRMMPMDAIRRG